MNAFTKNKLESFSIGGLIFSCALGAASFQARASDDDKKESSSHSSGQGQAADSKIVTGSIVKVKENKNEIYVRSTTGQRVEIYLDKSVKILKGTETMKLSDLTKDTKVKVTGKTLVEILP
jgi:hypothetical protein